MPEDLPAKKINHPPCKIMIVEDEAVVALHLKMMLQELGYSVCSVISSGEEAVNEVEIHTPDLIFMDIFLAGSIDGIEAATQICAKHHIPIIYITAYDDEDVIQRAKQTCPAGYLLKPYDKRQIRVTIEIARHIYGMIIGRKKAEEEISRLNQRHRLILDAAADAIIVLDNSGKITYANPAAARMSGYTISELTGQDLHLTLHHSRPDGTPYLKNECPLLNFTQEGSINAVRYEVLWKKDRSCFPISYTTAAIVDQNAPIGSIITFRDITERQRIEQQNRTLEDRLRQLQKMEALGTLAGGIAHDFNNILGAMLGYAQLAIMDAPPGTDLANFLEGVLSAGNRAAELVKQILTFSRQLENEPKPIHIAPIIKEALKLLRSSIPSTIDIKHHFSEPIGPILGDPTQIHQVLMNLCTNASQAIGDRPGIISINLKEILVTSSRTSPIFGLPEGRYVCLSIADDGPGINPEIQEKIFEPYFTTKAPGEGTGLGLATVHGIVQSHQGAIKLHSEPGCGTRFDIFLPRHYLPAKPEKDVQEAITVGSERILLVDDEEALIQMGARLLERLGYQVTARTSSLEALELFRAHPDRFDLVITDQTMPNMTGLGLAVELLRIKPDIPVILCTGFSTSVSPERIEKIGIKGLVMKPILVAELSKAIRKALDHRGVIQ